MVGPWVFYLEQFGGKEMGDIEYLAIKEFDGKTRKDFSFRSTSGTLATLTAATGKDMYVAVAEGSIGTARTDAPVESITVELKLNGTTIEEYNILVDNLTRFTDFKFKFSGKVTTGQIILIEATLNGPGVAMQMSGNLECFEEDTGTTPAIT